MKKAISFKFNPETIKKLKKIAIITKRTQTSLMEESIDTLCNEYLKNNIDVKTIKE